MIIRAAVAILLAAHILIKAFWPEYLAGAPWETKILGWLTWWLIIFLVLSTIAAFVLMPPFAAALGWAAERGFLPFFIFVLFLVGILWGTDLAWNATVARFCETCPESHLLSSFTSATFGASSP